MGATDDVTKEYMKDNNVFADAFNYLIYNGRQVIKPSSLQELYTTEIALVEDDKIQKYRDVLKSAVIKKNDKATYLLLGVENQTKIHYAMPVRNLLYDAIRYHTQIIEVAKRHKKDKDLSTKSEFLSGFSKEDKIMPIITLVIHFGPDKWDGPLSLHDMFEVDDVDILAFVPDYKMNLIDPADLDDSSLDKFSTGLSKLLGCIKYSKDKEGLAKYFMKDGGLIVDVKTAQAINDLTNLNLSIPEGKEEINMCKAMEELIKDGEAKGEARGKQSEKLEIYRGLVRDGILSARQASERSGIPEELLVEGLGSMNLF